LTSNQVDVNMLTQNVERRQEDHSDLRRRRVVEMGHIGSLWNPKDEGNMTDAQELPFDNYVEAVETMQKLGPAGQIIYALRKHGELSATELYRSVSGATSDEIRAERNHLVSVGVVSPANIHRDEHDSKAIQTEYGRVRGIPDGLLRDLFQGGDQMTDELHAVILHEVEDNSVTDLTDLLSAVGHTIPHIGFEQVVGAVCTLIAIGALKPTEVVATRKDRKCGNTGKFQAGTYRKRASSWSRYDTSGSD
jgi:hypothetical protein